MSFGELVNKTCKALLLGFLALVAALSVFIAWRYEPVERKEMGARALGVVHDVREMKLQEVLKPREGDAGVDMLTRGQPPEETYANFGAAWPRAARPPFNPRHNVVSEDHTKKVYIYESPGYRFYSDVQIDRRSSMHFATLFETTREFMKSLPLGMLKTGGENKKSNVLMFGEDETYYDAGGPRWSAGCYFPMKRLVLVPMSSLDLKDKEPVRGDPKKDHQVLIHELVHQLTPSAYYGYGSVGWFTEGLAEYVGTTPYHPGYFWVDTKGDTVLEYVRAYGQKNTTGRALGSEIKLRPLKEFMLMSYDNFAGSEGNLNYGASLLLVYYFFHMEGGGGAERDHGVFKDAEVGGVR